MYAQEKEVPHFLEAGRIVKGTLEVRLAQNETEIYWAQKLRYQVFYEEMKAKASGEVEAQKRDFDEYDAVADHLLVLDHAHGEGPQSVVGTYRLIRRPAAQKVGQFYTSSEYNIGALEGLPSQILELGRSCVGARYRTRHVMELLWRGLAAYVFHYDISHMFGCASFEGIDVENLKIPLSYLYHNHLAPPNIRTKALAARYVNMNFMAKEDISPRKAISFIPPLIKGYLRVGGVVGDGAVVDHEFNTTDVCIILKTDAVTGRYYKHYARRFGKQDETA